MAEDTFEMLTVEQMNELRNKDKVDKLDRQWVERIATVPLGAGFKMIRPEEENQRNFKRRIGDAARESGRTLDWTPQETNLSPGQEPKTYVVRIRAIDKTKAAQYAASKSGQNGLPNASQPAQNGTTDQSPEQVPEPAGTRRR